MIGSPSTQKWRGKTQIFQHCIFKFAQYTISFIQGFFHITVLPSFHTTRKIILQQCKRTVKHLQAVIHIRLLQHAETKTILFMSLADANISLKFICRGPTMSGFFF